MSNSSSAALAHSSWSETRLAQGLWFVAIVWAIAGAFLALEFVSTELLRRSIGSGWVSAELVMPTQERLPAALVCRQGTIDAAAAATVDVDNPVAMRQVRYASWMLGLQFGFAAGMAGIGSADAETASLREDLQRWAAVLDLPTPAAPKVQHIANELSEFGAHLEADPQCIAARLTRRYGPRYGYLYKFGAVVGHSIPALTYNIGGSFPLQMRRYGQEAGIAQELWLPMTRDSLDDVPGADPREKAVGLLKRLDDYIASQ